MAASIGVHAFAYFVYLSHASSSSAFLSKPPTYPEGGGGALEVLLSG